MDHPRYDPRSALTPLTPAELDALDTLLQGLAAHGAMPLDGLDGYLTAWLVGARAALTDGAPEDWLPAIWGGDDPDAPAAATPFASKRQRKDTVVRVLRHLRHLDEQLAHDPAGWEPIFSVAEQGARDLADARDWCTGFLQAVDAAPQAWPVDWADPAWAPLVRLGGGFQDAPADDPALDDPVACDALSRAVPDAVLALRERLGAAPGRPRLSAAPGTPR